ncbi:MAG TPA: thiamine-phosphate kinase [Sphingomicrobium sp.]|nr:thiamine-phosphate kinase [Sphingomicrobium sp.]
MNEADILDRLRRIATHPAARGLVDDVALVGDLVITHDTIAEGVHFLPEDPPESVGWKLVAVNLSDLAGKGAEPLAALLSLTLTGAAEWDVRFLSGIEASCESYGLPLVGGDTIALPAGAPRVLGLTAIGRAGDRTPSRAGGKPGDSLWLIGTVGDSAAGLASLQADPKAEGQLVDIYRRPIPLLDAGRRLAPHANAMMDVSDGLLLDAWRLAQASGCGAVIDLDTLPLSRAFVADRGDGLSARMFAATGGDDYALLAAFPAGFDPSLRLSLPSGPTVSRIGSLAAPGSPLSLVSGGRTVQVPEKLGFEHADDHDRDDDAPPMGDRP